MTREKAQVAQTARSKVPMRGLGADCSVLAEKRGNARGAKGAGHRRRAWVNRVNREEPESSAEGGSLRAMARSGGRESLKSGSVSGSGCNSPGRLGHGCADLDFEIGLVGNCHAANGVGLEMFPDQFVWIAVGRIGRQKKQPECG